SVVKVVVEIIHQQADADGPACCIRIQGESEKIGGYILASVRCHRSGDEYGGGVERVVNADITATGSSGDEIGHGIHIGWQQRRPVHHLITVRAENVVAIQIERLVHGRRAPVGAGVELAAN